MQFTQPNPAGGTIDVVNFSVPQFSRDVFYWPCIQGEQFPPTFVNSAGYGSFGPYPSVFANVGGPQTSSNAFWPNLPRVGSVNTKQTVTVNARLLLETSHVDAGQWIARSFSINPPGGTNPPFFQYFDQTDQAGGTVSVHSNVFGNTVVNVGHPVNDFWNGLEVIIHPDGTIDVFGTNGNALILAAPSEWTPTSVGVSATLACQSSAINQVGEIDVTQLQVQWT